MVFQGDGRGCLSERALKRRIAYFTNDNPQNFGFDVHVRARADGYTEFELERGGSSVAVRGFPTLPEACAERVDAIAIAIAIAMEQADSLAGTPVEGAPPPVQQAPANGVIASALPADASARELPADARDTTSPDDAPPVRTDEAGAKAPPADMRRDTPPPTPASRPGKRPADRYSVRAGAGVLFGLLPSPVVAALAGGDIGIFDGSLYISVSALLSGQTRDDLATGQLTAQLVAGRGALCYRVQTEWVALCVCPGVSIGGYITHGDDYDQDRDANLPWVAAFAHTGLRVFDGALKLELSVEGYANIVRPSMWVEGSSDEPFTAPVFALSSMAELLFVF
ncbi:MAG TPA: hypothetical protein VJV78_13560 [Polyangiales bacterium]|nr:hypothetical protein [Polyangiales bacterium]